MSGASLRWMAGALRSLLKRVDYLERGEKVLLSLDDLLPVTVEKSLKVVDESCIATSSARHGVLGFGLVRAHVLEDEEREIMQKDACTAVPHSQLEMGQMIRSGLMVIMPSITNALKSEMQPVMEELDSKVNQVAKDHMNERLVMANFEFMFDEKMERLETKLQELNVQEEQHEDDDVDESY